MLTILTAIGQAKFHLPNTIIGRVSLFSYIIHSIFQPTPTASSVRQLKKKRRYPNMLTLVLMVGAIGMEFSVLSGKEGCDYNGVDFVGIINIC